MRYYEDFEVGSKKGFDAGYEFTEEEIIEFAKRWDPQPSINCKGRVDA
ncbi:MAG: hypothetical protein V7744_05360 [Pseudomonadales bacterium]